ncbi:Protein VAC14-like protein, partial [Ophiophagus hannah]
MVARRYPSTGKGSGLKGGVEQHKAGIECEGGGQMFRHTDSLFPILLKTLSDDSDESWAALDAERRNSFSLGKE